MPRLCFICRKTVNLIALNLIHVHRFSFNVELEALFKSMWQMGAELLHEKLKQPTFVIFTSFDIVAKR